MALKNWRGNAVKQIFRQHNHDRLILALSEITKTAASLAPYMSGNLRGSLNPKMTAFLKGRVGTPVIYAAIQERGGIIKAINKPYLRFRINGRWVSVKQVKIEGKYYLRGSLEDAKTWFTEFMAEA